MSGRAVPRLWNWSAAPAVVMRRGFGCVERRQASEPVRPAHAGDTLISPQITRRLIVGWLPFASRPNADLFITLSTVKSHLAGIQGKLGLRNRVEIAAWAWETRLVSSPGEW